MIPLRDANPPRRTPVVTLAIIGTCFVTFAIELAIQATGGEAGLTRLFETFGVIPADLMAALRAGNVLSLPVLTLITYQFLHGGWLHIGANMLYLWIFGNNVEDRLGRPGFLLFYLAGGIIAALAAVLGAYAILFPRARVLTIVFLVVFFQLTEVPSIIVLGLWFVLQVIDGLASLGVDEVAGGVAIFAHIAGFVAGMLVGFLVRGVRPRPVGAG